MSFLRHTQDPPPHTGCPRCNSAKDPDKHPPQYRRWWLETTNHIIALRSSLTRQKLFPPAPSKQKAVVASRSVLNTLVKKPSKIDEVVAKSYNVQKPVFPKLRLTRKNLNKNDKPKLPVHVTVIEFPPREEIITRIAAPKVHHLKCYDLSHLG